MTGFGAAEKENGAWKIRAEIKSLNNKFFDLNLRLPKAFRDKEIELRQLLSNSVGRGSVSFILSAERKDSAQDSELLSLNLPLAKSLHEKISTLATQLNLNSDSILSNMLSFPDLIRYEENNASDEDWNFVKSCIEEASLQFDAFRLQEGKTIGRYIRTCLAAIREQLAGIEKEEQPRKDSMRGRLMQSLTDSKEDVAIDQNRFEQEMIYYLEKYDIGEEKSRLNHHLDFFAETLEKDGNGKKLGFIAQEMGREINTIGSKAYYFPIQQSVVLMKEELEKIKEQLLNVL